MINDRSKRPFSHYVFVLEIYVGLNILRFDMS